MYHGNATRGRCGRRGQATVELALSLMLLIVIMFAIFEFAWLFYNYANLYNTVSKACRLAVVQEPPPANNNLISTFVQAPQAGLSINAPTVTVRNTTGTPISATDRTAGNYLTVEATVNYKSITPLSAWIASSAIGTLKVSVSEVIE
jgi:Flp pilus assembly protein TadG